MCRTGSAPIFARLRATGFFGSGFGVALPAAGLGDVVPFATGFVEAAFLVAGFLLTAFPAVVNQDGRKPSMA